MTTPPANATEAVPKPVPPDGYGVLRREWLADNSLPEMSRWRDDYRNKWAGTMLVGRLLKNEALTNFTYAAPLDSAPPEAFAQPTPSGPTAGDSMDKYLEAALDRIAEQEEELGQLHELGVYLWPEEGGLPRKHRNPLVAVKAREELLRAALTTAETKAGAMEEAQYTIIDSRLNWPEPPPHEILDDNRMKVRWKDLALTLQAQRNSAEKERDAALARAESAEAIIRELPHGRECITRLASANRLAGYECDCFKSKIPPTPSVASEKEGK